MYLRCGKTSYHLLIIWTGTSASMSACYDQQLHSTPSLWLMPNSSEHRRPSVKDLQRLQPTYLQSVHQSPHRPPLRPPSNQTGYQTDPPASLKRPQRNDEMSEEKIPKRTKLFPTRSESNWSTTRQKYTYEYTIKVTPCRGLITG